MKNFLLKIFSCMFVIFGITATAFADPTYPFSVTTTNLSAGDTFTFTMTAKGTFYVDCGSGGELTSTANDVSGTTITRSNTTEATYTCTYQNSGGVKTIRFGGTATAYNSTVDVPAIRMTTPARVASIFGNISVIFPIRGGSLNLSPQFRYTFNGTPITEIPSTLFSSYTQPGQYMFSGTFSSCPALTSIPDDLFAGITRGANYMFSGTFMGSGITSIPPHLFSNITTSANYLFQYTFYGCNGLSNAYIPPTLFAGLIANNVTTPTNMWNSTFRDSALKTSCSGGTTRYNTPYDSYWNGKVSCIASYTVTYSCGTAGGTTPTSTTATEGSSFTPAANSCNIPNDTSVFVGWKVSGTNDIKPAGTAFNWNYTENKTLTATYSNGIPSDYLFNPSMCVFDVLATYGPSAELEANWTPNPINLNWYDGNQQLTVSAAAEGCTYDQGITLPSEPTKTGYHFGGWRVREPEPINCSDITDCDICNRTDGCVLSNGICRSIHFCETITSAETCAAASVCTWDNNLCVWARISEVCDVIW